MSECLNRNLFQGRQSSIGHTGPAPGRNPGGNQFTLYLKYHQSSKVLSQFNQTHSQALQTQIQAIQILLDKQGTIVSAVLPLLPLLQAVPLHIDATRNALNDAISKLALTQPVTSDSPNQTVPVKITGKRKRSQRSSSSSPLPESPSKKSNLTVNTLEDATPTTKVRSSRESDLTSSVRPFEFSSSSMLKSSPHEKSSALNPADTSASSSSRRNTFVPPNFSTPRKPLSDLVVQPPSAHDGSLKLSNNPGYVNSVPRSNTMSRPSPPVLLEIMPTAARPPRMLRVHASISNMRNKPMEPSHTNNASRGPMNHFQPNESDILTSSTLSGSDISAARSPSSPSPALAPFPPSRMNDSDPQGGPKKVSQNELAYKPRSDRAATNVQMPPPNQKVLSVENRPIASVKEKVMPTAVALSNMKETPVSRITFFSPAHYKTFSDTFFWIYRGLGEDSFRWLILKMKMKNSQIIN